MNRYRGFAGAAAQAMLTGALALSLGTATATLAQDATPPDDAAVTPAAEAAATAEPRRSRERRRAAQVPEEPRASHAAAVAVTETTAAALAPDPDETVETRIVCKNIKVLGTKISRRVCGTPEQWAAQARKTTNDAQETMRQVRDRSSIAIPQPESPLGAGN
jgi:hypothetical protein